MPHRHVESSQTGFQGRTHDDHDHLKIHRLYEDRPTDKSHYLMTAFGEVHAGEPIPGYYPGPAVVYIIEGELHVVDQSKPGEVSKLVAGDVLHIAEGSYNTWSSPSKVRVFGVCYAPSNIHPEDLAVKK